MTWLTVALGCFAIAAWASTILLLRAAIQRPFIGALTERAVIGFILSVFGSLCVVLAWTTDEGEHLLPPDVSRFVFTAALIVVLLIPTGWLGLYLMDRLGR